MGPAFFGAVGCFEKSFLGRREGEEGLGGEEEGIGGFVEGVRGWWGRCNIFGGI